MKIIIDIKNRKIKIALWRNQTKIDSLNIEEEHTLSEQLLPQIDKLLRNNQLDSQAIASVEVKSDQGDNFTTTRIARAMAETWNWNLQNY